MKTPRKTRFNEGMRTVSFRVPESKVEDFKMRGHSVLAMYSASQYLDVESFAKNIMQSSDVASDPKPKFVKEPTSIKSVPFTTKSIKVNGYRCDKEEDSDICYWKDTNTSALMFDDELHLKEYLTKHKP